MHINVVGRDLLQIVIDYATEGPNVDFMDLYPGAVFSYRNLVTSDKCEEILNPVVKSCLPEGILQPWQRNLNFDEKIDELIKLINTGVVYRCLPQASSKK